MYRVDFEAVILKILLIKKKSLVANSSIMLLTSFKTLVSFHSQINPNAHGYFIHFFLYKTAEYIYM